MPMMSPATRHIASPPLGFGGRSLEAISDDECVTLLAEAMDEHDAEHLDDVARLIARLAVPIEL
ncbi:MAG: hypothetical protein JWR73_1052 [Tardiphaga sp.]|nr:hypothetical protein [Tardiphaga sp.]